jgi:GNAT superfamily N-acetyltransferase
MELRAARHSERDEVLDLLGLWYNDREFFARYNRNDPKFRDELCLIARDGRALVATVQIFDRAVRLDGRATPMGGIGSVFTRADYRHQGVASALMRMAVDTLEREQFELSLLFAERLTFYNQFGWGEIGRKFSVLANATALRPPGECEIIDVFDPARDLDAIVSIHRDYSGRFNISAVRDAADWQGNLTFAGNQPSERCTEYFVIARSRTRPTAYARVTRFYGVTMVMEYGYSDGMEDDLVTLFQHLGEVATGARCLHRLQGDHRRAAFLTDGTGASAPAGVLVTHTAHDKSFESRLTAAGATVTYHLDNNYMWRIVSAEKLGRRLGLSPDRAAARAFELFASNNSLFWSADRF